MHRAAAILPIILLLAAPAAAAPRKLPRLGADPARVSVSGLSSGAFMAVQYGTAFSGSTTGVGVVAGGPFNCAAVNFGSIVTCMRGAPGGRTSFESAGRFAMIGAIDPVAGLAAQKIYLFSGTKDAVVAPTVVDGVRDFYLAAGVPAANLQYVRQFAAGHAFISDDFGGACDANAAPFVNECPDAAALYDQPAAILRQLLGPLKPKAATPSAKPAAFDQRPFTGMSSSMAATGYVYVPAACRRGRAAAPCAVHVVFHGCVQSAASVGDAVYGRLGYNEWADSNGIVILYPQVDKSLFNPQGCWDWWGYTGLSFPTQGGAQLAVVNAMVKQLTSR